MAKPRESTVINGQKLCLKCGKFMDIKLFSKHRSSNDGYRYKCVKCHFYEKFCIDDNGCWIWIACMRDNRNHDNYGAFEFNGRTFSAHIFSYELHNNIHPGELCVLHKCDVKRCVNPAHLFLGTQECNVHDMMLKDRCGLSKLTVQHIKQIKEEYKIINKSYGSNWAKKIANKYNVSISTINSIMNGTAWSYVDPEPTYKTNYLERDTSLDGVEFI